MTEEKWAYLTVEQDPIKASLLEGRLKAEGIQVVLQGEVIGKIYGLTVGPLADTKIFVPVSQLEKARQIVKEIENHQA